MNNYRHHVSGLFAHREDAESAFSKLIERGLSHKRLTIFENDQGPPAPKASSDKVLQDVVVDGAIGTAVGTGIGALAEVALVAANVSLFVASPVLAPLMMLGWGASLGGIIGATTGASAGEKVGPFSELIRDAISSNQVVLVAETHTEQETAIAREVIKASVGDTNDVNTA